ncbi:hypothetical protein D3880_04965 [Pseudomonas cavernae]|uniref:Uncharacterized protein n=1 Tax=Pseudomonas cavernae TaxID=2320867 RepID=A0A385YZ05_9PSED|nr:hypothetical protein [Pseudomonas cavernae]AYC31774.1 hypothetical protein D3880_04965 [Pseudomonas cavernae]
MRAIYIDTEFTQLSPARQLISLALVDSAGAEFYVELTDTWHEDDCSDFVRDIVLPQLDGQRYGMPSRAACQALHGFLAGLGEVEIVGDALAWDWPLLLELLGPAGLPANVTGCRQVDDPLAALPADAVPHHALLDARLLCALCETAAE